jgi:hypothetical protein
MATLYHDFPQNSNSVNVKLAKGCKYCDSSNGLLVKIDPLSGLKHSYRLECRDCGRYQRWVGKKEVEAKLGGCK